VRARASRSRSISWSSENASESPRGERPKTDGARRGGFAREERSRCFVLGGSEKALEDAAAGWRARGCDVARAADWRRASRAGEEIPRALRRTGTEWTVSGLSLGLRDQTGDGDSWDGGGTEEGQVTTCHSQSDIIRTHAHTRHTRQVTRMGVRTRLSRVHTLIRRLEGSNGRMPRLSVYHSRFSRKDFRSRFNE
jgi:hypothetical protein